MSANQIPNLITVLRFMLVPPVVVFIVQDEFTWALILFLVAGVSDGIDGFLARRFNWRTQLGAVLDPLADKTLMFSVYLTLGLLAHLPPWLVALVILRDVVIVLGAFLYHRLIGKLEMAPSLLSKLNTVLQIVLVLAVLVHEGPFAQWPEVVTGLIVLVSLSTLASGVDYVMVWGRLARGAHRHGTR